MENFIEQILDVTTVEPKRKHPMIFELFDALPPGRKLTILNDHDPKPLYYQLMAERGQVFKWQYIENGPVNWKVEITRHGNDDTEETIGQISRADIRKIEVFKKYGIDFCCGGNKTLREACEEKGLDILQVKEDLEKNDSPATENMAYDEWQLDFLCDFIVHRHHSYIRKQNPVINEMMNKVVNAHSDAHPELRHLKSLWDTLAAELGAHIQKEEVVLFPYIKQLQHADTNRTQMQAPSFGSVNTPVNIMMMEHESAGELLEEMRYITGSYKLPEDACNSYRFLFELIRQYEEDLKLHIHLENNILFPKALLLEKQINL